MLKFLRPLRIKTREDRSSMFDNMMNWDDTVFDIYSRTGPRGVYMNWLELQTGYMAIQLGE